MNVPRDLTGQTFGRLTAKTRTGSDRYGNAIWECVCTCGRVIRLIVQSLNSGNSRSCGCLQNEARANTSRSRLKHGRVNTPEYRSWKSMIARCCITSNKDYRNWGARGISICDRWRHDFLAFLADMGERPSSQHTLDRIDNNGHYEPGNCRWATKKEQIHNRKRGVVKPMENASV